MKRLGLVYLLSVLVLFGCSKNDKPIPRAKQEKSKASSDHERAVRQTTQAFMGSVVRGDALDATKWLTPLAILRARSDPNFFAPLGFSLESLEIKEVRLISDFEAAAECELTEPGSQLAEVVCCLLKRSEVGWRVCGMACDAGPNNPPVVISFEHEPQPIANPQGGQFVDNRPTSMPDTRVPHTASTETGSVLR